MWMIYRLKNLAYRIKWFIQRLIRPNRLSDVDLYGADVTIFKRTIPILVAFRKMKKHGVPGLLALHRSVDDAVIVWDIYLREMIFAMKYYVIENSSKRKQRKFLKEYGYPKNSLDYDTEEDKKIMRDIEERAKTGLSYFSDHIRDLWD